MAVQTMNARQRRHLLRPETPGLGHAGLDAGGLAPVAAAVLAHVAHLPLAPHHRLLELAAQPLARVLVVLVAVRGEPAVGHDLVAHLALAPGAVQIDLLLRLRDDARRAPVLLLLGGALGVARGGGGGVLVRVVHVVARGAGLVGVVQPRAVLCRRRRRLLAVHALLVLVAPVPQRVAHGHVLLPGRPRRLLRRRRPARRHRVHQPLPLAPLQLLCHLHQVRHVVAEVPDLRQRVHGPRRGLRAAPLHLGQRHAREEVLLNLGARLHARELALSEGAGGVALVAAQLLGRLAQLLRQLLDERASGRPPPRLLLLALLLGALAPLLVVLGHRRGQHLGWPVHARAPLAPVLLRVLVHLGHQRVGVGAELQGVLAAATLVARLGALVGHLQQLLDLVLQLAVDGAQLLEVRADLHQPQHHGVVAHGLALALEQQVEHDVDAVRQHQQVLGVQVADALGGGVVPRAHHGDHRLHGVAHLVQVLGQLLG
mmetsp:Transcript_29360/g.72632  ORF Transcript_29360/g.72632 Transcript_29360/m.72632 type:complete len:485 (+) Transcript_29360:173-1627(+)